MIHTENLSKIFGNVRAVEDLSINVGEGQVFGFLGPNGAGKTTTVRMLTSLIHPTSGSARVADFQIGKEDTQIRRSVGILTEAPGFYDNLSAWKNLLIFARLYEVPNPEAQVAKYLDMMGLTGRKDDETGTFSKGMKQRLAIARAILHEPKVIFFDEPTAGLDPEAARLVRDFINELRRQSRTIFLCTHNLDEADKLCDQIAVFKTRLLVVGTPEHLRAEVFGRVIVVHLLEMVSEFEVQVANLPFVRSTQIVENKLLVGIDEPEIHNPDLIRVLVGLGAQIQFVGELRRSLEDVYLEMVKAN
jgi:ABC-2 type transport system ATP-binding protein